MAVGVPEHEVFAAADAVLARGERPTVERVRLELGKGSPARVGALLDQWWEQLASRLRGETRLPGLPAEVAQAFVALWQQATTLAQGVMEQSMAAQRQVLADEREALAEVEAKRRLEVVEAQRQAVEAIASRQRIETRLTDLEQLLAQRQAQIDDLRAQREELLTQCDDARQQLGDIQQRLHTSLAQAEQARAEQQRYSRDVEDRAYREIDRAREENKVMGLQLKDALGRLSVAQQALQADQLTLADSREQTQTARAQAQLVTAQLDQAQQRSIALSEQNSDLHSALQALREELASARERAAAAQARAEALASSTTRSQKKNAPKGRA
ncbi:DNA-binding protein [Pseudomonas silvicola]|nr:DNA-binding protein [Pseudomonas silvicola]